MRQVLLRVWMKGKGWGPTLLSPWIGCWFCGASRVPDKSDERGGACDDATREEHDDDDVQGMERESLTGRRKGRLKEMMAKESDACDPDHVILSFLSFCWFLLGTFMHGSMGMAKEG